MALFITGCRLVDVLDDHDLHVAVKFIEPYLALTDHDAFLRYEQGIKGRFSQFGFYLIALHGMA